MPQPFPFSAIVGQDEMKLALLIAAIDPTVGGVLVFGDRGTGKSTAVRALAVLLPPMRLVEGCRYGCDPDVGSGQCEECRTGAHAAKGARKSPAGSGSRWRSARPCWRMLATCGGAGGVSRSG